MQIPDKHNDLVQLFRMARDSFRKTDYKKKMSSLAVEVIQYNGKRCKTCNRPTSSEVTALLVDDFVDINSQRS